MNLARPTSDLGRVLPANRIQRRVSPQHRRFKDKGRYANELASLILNTPATARLYLDSLGFAPALCRRAAMQRHARALAALRDAARRAEPCRSTGRPRRRRQLTVNYIDWLASADELRQDHQPGFPRLAKPSACSTSCCATRCCCSCTRAPMTGLSEQRTSRPGAARPRSRTDAAGNVRAGADLGHEIRADDVQSRRRLSPAHAFAGSERRAMRSGTATRRV